MGIEHEFLCAVCHDVVNDPVTLHCSHHLCAAHVTSFPHREPVQCPICNESSSVPEGGLKIDAVKKIVVDHYKPQGQDALHDPALAQPTCGLCEEKQATKRCVQCDGCICEDCEKSVHAKGYFRSHTVLDLNEVTDMTVAGRMVCPDHQEKLDFYCLDCRSPVCAHCLILGDHKGHRQTPIQTAFETGKDTLDAWIQKLNLRIASTEALLDNFRLADEEISRNGETQRAVVNSEMDHLRELIETKRRQLLQKSALEEKQKRVQLQAQIERAEAARVEAKGLVGRSEVMLELDRVHGAHTFLIFVLALIQDMKRCADQPVDDNQRVSTTFRSLSTDAQVRVLGDLDLCYPRPQTVSAQHGQPCMGGIHQTDSAHPFVLQPYNGSSATTMPYVPQHVHVANVQPPQVQIVYRASVPPQ